MENFDIDFVPPILWYDLELESPPPIFDGPIFDGNLVNLKYPPGIVKVYQLCFSLIDVDDFTSSVDII